MINKRTILGRRFRGLMPVVVDVETSGLNPATDALLEIALVMVSMDSEGRMICDQTIAYHVESFPGARLEKEALEITGINPVCPLRFAVPEGQVLHRIFSAVNERLEQMGCYRAILVGHNAWFDLSFILTACARNGIMNIPFHTFTTLDTATLSAVLLGETVLARALRRARIPFDVNKAHSAIYDAEKTAQLFCHLVNKSKAIF
jgi:ribonuclease T